MECYGKNCHKDLVFSDRMYTFAHSSGIYSNQNKTAMRKILLTALICSLISCGGNGRRGNIRAAYYWSTVLDIDSQKTAFINGHAITRLYIRYFDVVVDDGSGPMPNATLQFRSLPDSSIEIIPTVFITNECMKVRTNGLAEKILGRVLQMSETNGVRNVKGVQIDCDWTMGTRKRFFAFMEEMRQLTHQEGLELSATIRLHQLSQAPPPCDRGILMMYNTGDVADFDCRKPILDMADAGPYMRHLDSYELPLSSAYPLFRWEAIFRNGRFVGIQHYEGEYPTLPTDSLRTYQPKMGDIMKAKEAIEKRRPEANDEIILYDLNNYNIKRFNQEDYEKILSH